MYRFFSTLRTTLVQKKTLVMVIPAMLGLVGGSSLVMQGASFAFHSNPVLQAVRSLSYGCSSYNASQVESASLMGAISSASEQALAQANHTSNAKKMCASNISARMLKASYNQSAVAATIYRVFGPYSWGAMRVAMCESGLNPYAYNPYSSGGSHAEGVFQILYPSTWMGTSQAAYSPYDATANILAAYNIFARDGYSWREWSCRP